MGILDKLHGKAEQAEKFFVENEATTVSFEANVLKSAEVEETRGVALRVVADGRLGFAASSDLGAEDRLIANALESAHYGDALPLCFPCPQPGTAVTTFDERVTALSIERLAEMGQEIVDLVCRADADAHVNVDLERGVRRAEVRNSSGTQAVVTQSPLEIVISVERVRGDDVLIVYDSLSITVWDDDYLNAARQISRKLELARELTTIRSGVMPVLFSPKGTTVLSLPLMLGLDGKNVYRRVSPMAGKLGEKLFDSKLTMVDDPTLDGRPGSAPYDDEGVPRRRNVLIEEGTLHGFLYDLKTAAQAGVESTGSGSRGLFGPPAPSPSNLILASGGDSFADILADIQEGLLVDTPLGLGQGNVISGAFANTLGLAYKIERGEIVGRVKDVSIAGNVYELLDDIAAISRESEWVYGGLKLPYILLPALNVVSKG
ncbi:MAG: TldD/PmbA family protein [Chloroflexota bacterium]|nr:TldD/PmbA family protein [Chloroflexota bacterium]